MAYISFQPSDHFNTKLWTGNATNSTAITGVGFQPDFVWIKNRSTTANHNLFDAIRGATYRIYSDDTSAQVQATDSLASFDSDGFTLNDGSPCNGSGNSVVGWNWKANGSGSSNSDGTTSSTVSASTTSGFSIVQHSGSGGATTIGHGLGVAPKIVLSKRTSGTNSWFFQQNIIGGSWTSSNYLILNSTAAAASSSSIVNNVSSSTISFAGGDDWVNASGSTYIHYVFAEKKGFSKFGSYTGNGNADGSFIYTGFKPAFIMIKRTDTTGDWLMKDNKRPTVQNPVTSLLYPNTSGAEATGVNDADFLSNGYKIRTTGTAENASGGSYIYMAFSEESIVSSNGIPAVAR